MHDGAFPHTCIPFLQTLHLSSDRCVSYWQLLSKKRIQMRNAFKWSLKNRDIMNIKQKRCFQRVMNNVILYAVEVKQFTQLRRTKTDLFSKSTLNQDISECCTPLMSASAGRDPAKMRSKWLHHLSITLCNFLPAHAGWLCWPKNQVLIVLWFCKSSIREKNVCKYATCWKQKHKKGRMTQWLSNAFLKSKIKMWKKFRSSLWCSHPNIHSWQHFIFVCPSTRQYTCINTFNMHELCNSQIHYPGNEGVAL